jgi:hypothetical protein
MRSTILGAGMALALTLTLCVPAHAATHHRSCWLAPTETAISRCFIDRAAARFGQPRSQAFAIAYRESRYHWHATNRSSGAAGIFQFMPTTWAHSPYRRHSPYNPKWAAMAAMWYWAHGGKYHWAL